MQLERLNPPTTAELAQASGVAKTAAQDWKAYCRACRTRAQVITAILQRRFGSDLEGKDVLDWGCAVGGVSFILSDELPIKMSAADVDEHSVNWINRAGGPVATSVLVPNCLLYTSPSPRDS